MADYTLSAKITGDSSGFEKAFSTAQKTLDSFQTKVQTITGKLDGISQKLSSASKSFAPFSAAATAAGVAGVKTFANFESQMSKVGAITGDVASSDLPAIVKAANEMGLAFEDGANATETAMNILEAKAKQMGAQTKFSATESGQAMEYMAMAGWKTADMLNGIEGIMSLAAASGEDLATTSDIVTDALTAFGMSAADSSHFSDVLAQASANANTNVSLLGESFKYVAPVAGAMKYSVEDVSIALGLMANSSIKGSMAGTALKTAIANMASPTKKMAAAMNKYGISLTETDGSMKSFKGVIDNLRSSLGNLSETEQTAAATAIFGKEAMAGMLAIINASPQDYEKLTAAINNADGAAKKMADTMQDNLSGRITSMKSKLEGVAIIVGEVLEPYMSKTVSSVTRFADAFINLDRNSQKTAVAIMAVVAAIAPALMMMSKLTSGISMGIKALSLIATPAGIVVAALTVLTAGFAYLMTTNESFRDVVMEVWGAVQSKITSVISGIDFSGMFAGLLESIRATHTSISQIDFSGVFAGLSAGVQAVIPVLGMIFTAIQQAVIIAQQVFLGFFEGVCSGFEGGISGAQGFQSGIMAAIGLISPGLKMLLVVFQLFGPQILSLVSIIGESLVPVFSTLGTTIGGIASAVIPAIQSAIANLLPVIIMVANTVLQVVTTVLPVLVSLINQLAPFLVQIAGVLGQVLAALAPMIAQLVGALLPVITNIITVLSNVITAVMPSLIAILNVAMSVIQTLVPIIMDVLSVVISVVSGIISAINPIISYIGMVISLIMAIISPIVTFIANIIAAIVQVIGTIIGTVTGIFSAVHSIVTGVFTNISNFISTTINGISSVISTLTGIFGGVFNSIYSVVSLVMGNVRNYITGVFNGIKSAWNGLTAFVSGVFSGIGSAVQQLVSQVKGFVNGVIGGINAAVGLINMIPGVSIGRIPYLARGTDDWAGGFARINEGGRGELTYLPNGSQVIPHDISVKYAKEAARVNSNAADGGVEIDYDRLINGMVSALRGIKIENNMNLGKRTFIREIVPLIDAKMAQM